jgi:zinc protease
MMIENKVSPSNFPAGFTFIKSLGDIAEYRLDRNRLRILLRHDGFAPAVTFMITYLVGSRNEAVGHTGATHLLEHMMFKGTPAFNKEKGTPIVAMLQRVGAFKNATTWLDRTNYYETVPDDQLELAMQIEADRMRHSLIRDEAGLTYGVNSSLRTSNHADGVWKIDLSLSPKDTGAASNWCGRRSSVCCRMV